ncbi:unnamed protein product [Kluyveromyces dobzhanskii CBS 2104]|uniref:WGS project CCBQ000000000 data, contig 00006 n=1 Tax=Kluyveromyces dobzhanskii CBS 2104 TaxID=1427455 RepID=A0A0A8L8H4_9SACH|nr:unnamed protein product [Kluyveromyces dobzhanskii CBS 2104]
MSSLIFNRCINITDHNVRFAKAWNRLQVEEFKHCFPQLFANYRITQSDSQMVSEYLQTQGQVQNNAAKRIFPKLHFKSPAPVHTQDHTTNKDCSEQQFMGKRQRTSISSFTNVSPLSEPNSNIMENLEDCDFLDSRKRRR